MPSRLRTVVALTGVLVTATALLIPTPVGATIAAKASVSPAAWAERFCTGYQDFQAAALDARDASFPVVRTPVADRTQVKASAKALQGALKPPTVAARDITRARCNGAHPRGKAASRSVPPQPPRSRASPMHTTPQARARESSSACHRRSCATRAPRVLIRLDTELDRAAKPLTRLEGLVRTSEVYGAMVGLPMCNRLGLDWSPLDIYAAKGATPPPTAISPATPGADDITAPSILLPGRYRPSPDVAAVAARTTMTGLGRTYFYGGEPVIETGPSFLVHCPNPEASTLQVLGCYHDNSIYVLAVTKPELASVVDVTAAHEMLHAVYDGMDTTEVAAIDPLLAAFYDASTDPHLHSIVAQYEERAPGNRANELHSLIGTQVATLTPPLDAYYAKFFRDRGTIARAYTAYVSVFDGLISRYRDLDAQLDDLGARITSLRNQANAAGGEAQRLGAEIDSLRAQGRFAESNALVSGQNDAVRRAQSFEGQANGLIGQYNAVVGEVNAIAAELGGLKAALRPTG